MEIQFKQYTDEYYEQVCQFLIQLNAKNVVHINWNWARWEWMVYHQDFDRTAESEIGLWFKENELVGFATYDYYYGEGFVAASAGYKSLNQRLLEYAVTHFLDESGFGIAVNDNDKDMIALAEQMGFEKHENTENVLELDITKTDLSYCVPEDIKMSNVNGIEDASMYNEMLWKGMNHEGDVPNDIDTIRSIQYMLSARHARMDLNVVAKKDEEWLSFCGCWYDRKTSYAYIEPVCTKPEYRKMGLGKAAVFECLARCKKLGAQKAYVISEDSFYKKLGFIQSQHYSFYWYKPIGEKKE